MSVHDRRVALLELLINHYELHQPDGRALADVPEGHWPEELVESLSESPLFTLMDEVLSSQVTHFNEALAQKRAAGGFDA